MKFEFQIIYPDERWVDYEQIVRWGKDCADNHDLDFDDYVEVRQGSKLNAAVSLLEDFGEVTFAYDKDNGRPIHRKKMH